MVEFARIAKKGSKGGRRVIEYTVKVYANGDKLWRLNGRLHREDGPAAEHASGHKEWWINGELHREDGPAIECANGAKHWYLNGKRISKEEHASLTNQMATPRGVSVEMLVELPRETLQHALMLHDVLRLGEWIRRADVEMKDATQKMALNTMLKLCDLRHALLMADDASVFAVLRVIDRVLLTHRSRRIHMLVRDVLDYFSRSEGERGNSSRAMTEVRRALHLTRVFLEHRSPGS